MSRAGHELTERNSDANPKAAASGPNAGLERKTIAQFLRSLLSGMK